MRPTFLQRMQKAFGPLAGGIILDLVDLATFGPIGLVCGLFVGALVGWWVARIYNFSPRARWIWTSVCGLYCMVPFTCFLPVMTIVSAVANFAENPASTPADASPPSPDTGPAAPEGR